MMMMMMMMMIFLFCHSTPPISIFESVDNDNYVHVSSACVQCAIHTWRHALGGLGGGGGGSEEDHATHKPSHRWVDESGARYRFTPLTGRSHLSQT